MSSENSDLDKFVTRRRDSVPNRKETLDHPKLAGPSRNNTADPDIEKLLSLLKYMDLNAPSSSPTSQASDHLSIMSTEELDTRSRFLETDFANSELHFCNHEEKIRILLRDVISAIFPLPVKRSKRRRLIPNSTLFRVFLSLQCDNSKNSLSKRVKQMVKNYDEMPDYNPYVVKEKKVLAKESTNPFYLSILRMKRRRRIIRHFRMQTIARGIFIEYCKRMYGNDDSDSELQRYRFDDQSSSDGEDGNDFNKFSYSSF